MKSIRIKGKLLEWWEETENASAIARDVLISYIYQGKVTKESTVTQQINWQAKEKEVSAKEVVSQLDSFDF